MPLVHLWHEPSFQAPYVPETLDTPRDQRTPGEVASYLKSRFYPKPYQGRKARELRWVTTCLTSDPTEDSVPKYADWEACASLFVVINILTHNDDIRHSVRGGIGGDCQRPLGSGILCSAISTQIGGYRPQHRSLHHRGSSGQLLI